MSDTCPFQTTGLQILIVSCTVEFCGGSRAIVPLADGILAFCRNGLKTKSICVIFELRSSCISMG